MFMIRRLLAQVAGLGVVAALAAGCATATLPPPISTDAKLTGQEGAVVFKFITNGIGTSDPAETLSSVTVMREAPAGTQPSSTDRAVLTRTRSVFNSTAVFSGMIAPGTYRLLHANGMQGNMSYTFPLGSVSSRFEVKKDEVTLLGTLLVQPLEGTRFVIGHVPPDAELNKTFELLFPALAQQTRGKPVNTFEPSPELARRAQFAPQFRQLTTAYNGLKAHTDGSLLAGSKMGRAIWRKAGDSRWRTLQIDTWREVLSLRAYRNGLLAAGEEGLLQFTADEGKTWQVLTPPEQSLIAAAEPIAGGKVLALARRDTHWTAYVSDDAMAGQWRKIGSFEQERSLNVPWQNAIALASGNLVGVMMPNGNFPVVDGITEKIERRSTGVSTFGAQAMPDGMLLVMGGTMTRSAMVSVDGGKTWTDLNTSRFIGVITFVDPRTAYAIAPVDPGLFAGAYALMVTRDGAKTWKKTGEVPGGTPGLAQSLFYDRSDGSLLAFMQNGTVLRSGDEGKTWTRSL
jgi:photosystem II stability/assembly factor-like uncharacterized protein